MREGTDDLSREELAFFGRVSAGISHELKNIMATISETASLLSDLVAFGEKGGKVEQEELRACSDGIIEEVQRGFTTIKHMNAFAHSVDEPLKEVNVHDLLELTVNLSRYLNPGKKVRLDSSQGAGLRVLTSPFLLQDVFYHALVFAFKSLEADGEVQIGLRPDGGGVRIDFSGIGAGGEDSLLTEKVKAIAGAIHAEVLFSPSGDGFRVLLPPEIETG